MYTQLKLAPYDRITSFAFCGISTMLEIFSKCVPSYRKKIYRRTCLSVRSLSSYQKRLRRTNRLTSYRKKIYRRTCLSIRSLSSYHGYRTRRMASPPIGKKYIVVVVQFYFFHSSHFRLLI